MPLDTADYRALFLNHTPMIDLRAPAEFARGAFPSALSLPLMTDDERAQVGTCYKQQGRDAAIALGHELVRGETRQARMESWLAFARDYPEGCVYCWRGGLRSATVQEWLAAAGAKLPRVVGGYKAMRRYLIDSLATNLDAIDLVLISGQTGTGKTRVIERLPHSVDLEGLANHRGSSFGQMPTPQPSQIDFENSISIALLRCVEARHPVVFVEDEGRLIGRLAVPETLRSRMVGAPMAMIEAPLEERVSIVLEDYVVDLGKRYALRYQQEGANLHAQKLLSDLGRIRKRLGGDRHRRACDMLRCAFTEQWRTGSVDPHREWIGYLLAGYYDPMYNYQLGKREGAVEFRGSRSAVLEYAQERAQRARAE